MKFIATHTIRRAGKTIITKGDVLTEAQVNKKKVTAYVTRKTVGDNVTLTDAQFQFIIDSHNAGGSRQSVVSDFQSRYPECTVPVSSLNRYKAMCEVCDDSHPYSDKMVCHTRLVDLFMASI